jgi:hypothetical protein
MNNNNSFYDNISGYDITINNDGDICLIVNGKEIRLVDNQQILNQIMVLYCCVYIRWLYLLIQAHNTSLLNNHTIINKALVIGGLFVCFPFLKEVLKVTKYYNVTKKVT